MHRSDLGDLTAFMAVADHLNFRAAASRLGITPSALSHSMRQLEERLAVRLLNRTTRSMSLTDAGFRLLERLRPAIEQIDEALEDLNQERQRPFGRLRIYAGQVAIAAVVVPIWSRFLSTYPDVHLELQVGEAPIDIVAKGFDAGIGTHDRAAIDMVAVRVTGPVRLAAVGAPSYFARRKKPSLPEDLGHHRCVQYRLAADGAVLEWPFRRGDESQKIAVEGAVMVVLRERGRGPSVRREAGPWRSRRRPSRSSVQASSCAYWRNGRPAWTGSSSITRAIGRCRRHCARLST